jgi:hypothetical protein
MTQLEINDSNLIIKVQGADKLWALKSQLTIPLQHITDISYNPEEAKGWYHGLKLPGSQIPGVLTAGTFYKSGQKVFWDVHNPEQAIVIGLQNESYQKLIIEVSDPRTEVERVSKLIK